MNPRQLLLGPGLVPPDEEMPPVRERHEHLWILRSAYEAVPGELEVAVDVGTQE
jgi:hypothetical protein